MTLKETRGAALNLLARREHSHDELTRKLLAKGFQAEQIQSVLTELIQQGLLNHHRFIESYIHARQRKGFGPLRIHAELQSKGIPEELIEHHLKMTDNTWLAEVRVVWRKRFKNQLPVDMKSRAQQMRFYISADSLRTN